MIAKFSGSLHGDKKTSDTATVIQRACPVCGGRAGACVARRDPWRLVECSGCGLAYLPAIPTAEAVDSDFEWSASFARERRARWQQRPGMRLWTLALLGLFWLRGRRERRALRQIRRYVPRGNLLDIGSGDGRLLAAAQRGGFDVLGVELSPQMVQKAARRVATQHLRCGRLADFDLPRASFDVVVSVSYLEHEPDPAGVLRRAYELLRPRGVTLHKVPNYASRLRKVLGARWSGYRWPEHVQYYTPQTLGRLLESTGFEVIGVRALQWADNFWIAARKPSASGAAQG